MSSNLGLFKRALQYRSKHNRLRRSRVRIASTPLPFPPHRALSHEEARDVRSRLRLQISVGTASPHGQVLQGEGARGGWLPAFMLTVSVVAGLAAGDVALEAFQGARLSGVPSEFSFVAASRRDLEQELWDRNAAIAGLRRRLSQPPWTGSGAEDGPVSTKAGRPASSGLNDTAEHQDLRAELASLIAQRDLAYAVGRRRLLSLEGRLAEGPDDTHRSPLAAAGSELAQLSVRTRGEQLAERAVAGFYETVIRRLRRGDVLRAAASLESLGEYLDAGAGAVQDDRRIDVERFVWAEVHGPVLHAARAGRGDHLSLATRTASMVELREAVFRGDLLLRRGRFREARRSYRRALATLVEAQMQTNGSFPARSRAEAPAASGTGSGGAEPSRSLVPAADQADSAFRSDLEERVTWLASIEEERTALQETIASLRREIGDIEESLAALDPLVPGGKVLPNPATTAIGAQRRRLERVVDRYRALLDAAFAASVQDVPSAGALGGD